MRVGQLLMHWCETGLDDDTATDERLVARGGNSLLGGLEDLPAVNSVH